jgi:hypothetical protein
MSEQHLAQLAGMGFPAHCARDALAKSGGDVAMAISRLVGTAAQDVPGGSDSRPTRARDTRTRSPTGAATAIDLTDTPSPAAPRSSPVEAAAADGLRGWIAAAKSRDAGGSAKRRQRDSSAARDDAGGSTNRHRNAGNTMASDAALAAELQRCEEAGAQPARATAARGAGAPTDVPAHLRQPDCDARTDGLIALLKDQYRLPSGPWAKRATAATAEVCPHFTQRGVSAREEGTHGWSCGYRNAQMLCAALLAGTHGDAFHEVLFGGVGVVPSVRSLQGWIERAWDEGWDPSARSQFKGGRVVGTQAWIGTSEGTSSVDPIVSDQSEHMDGIGRLVLCVASAIYSVKTGRRCMH